MRVRRTAGAAGLPAVPGYTIQITSCIPLRAEQQRAPTAKMQIDEMQVDGS